MTSYETIYNAFLSKILEDEWASSAWTQAEREEDWRQLLESALPWFKFPRVSLEHGTNGFTADLSQMEIQIIATYMEVAWLNRCIMSWQNVKPLYTEQDFSQANLLDKLKALLDGERANAKELESVYYRSRNGKPFDFSQLATRIDD